MNSTLRHLLYTAAALLLMACAHKPEAHEGSCPGCTSVYVEGGQLTVAHLVSADPSEVERVAASYCRSHQSGAPVIKQPPELSRHPGWAMYSFSCEGTGTGAVVAAGEPASPVAPQPSMPPAAGSDAARFDETCTGMGFRKDTREYGDCVSKLTEMKSQAQQLRQEQRKQAIKLIEQGLSGLSAPTAAPTPITIRLPGGEVLTCLQTGSQVSCN
jgi:hypothetical protein